MTQTPLVQALMHGLAVLEAMAREEEDWQGVSELAARLRMHKSTVLRLLATLEACGYVEQDAATKRYRLRLKLFELGSQVIARTDLLKEARPILEQLNRETGEVVHLGVLDQGEVVYVEKMESTHTIRMHSRIGRRSPLHCTGVGKALLAWLPEEEVIHVIETKGLKRYTPNTIVDRSALLQHLETVRQLGVAFDNEEHEPGIRCVAAPVWDRHGRLAGAISVAGPSLRMTPERLQSLAEPVRQAALEISRRLGYTERDASAAGSA
ncbi:MAG: IclR family transcriptional regulator [Clostridia bacterium]|nr:IclR family transcriptional regulator [Clostridia bacterium]